MGPAAVPWRRSAGHVLAGGTAARSVGDAPELVGVELAQPVLRAARVTERFACGQGIQVTGVSGQAPAEFGSIPYMPVTRNHPAHAGQRRELLQAGPVIT